MTDTDRSLPPWIPFDFGADPRQGTDLPTVAALCSSYFPRSHSQHTVDRFLMGYEFDGQRRYPPFRVVSLYVDRPHEELELGRLRAEQYDLRLCPDIATALTLGTGQLAVDYILLVCENGDYPSDDRGTILYPRYEFFKEVIDVFRGSGRSVPVFNDKHLSHDWAHAKWIYDQQQELGFPMLAGSSLPVTWRLPELEFPPACQLEEAVVAYPGHVESYGIHALEALQCLVERRGQGETGIRAVQCLQGGAVWEAAAAGRWSRSLLDEALARRLPRSIVERQRTWTPQDLAAAYAEHTSDSTPLEEAVTNPTALLVEYRDGLRAACINLEDHVGDFTFAARHADGKIDSTLFFLGGPPESAYHGIQVHHIEELFLTKAPNYPLERTLLTTGALAFLMESLPDQRRVETPELAIEYQAPDVSQQARGLMPLHCSWAPHGLYEPTARALGVWPEV